MNYKNLSIEDLIAALAKLEEENKELRNSLEKIKSNTSVHHDKDQHEIVDYRDTKEYLELIFNTSPDAAIITRLTDGKIIDVNKGFTKLTGYTKDEALGQSSTVIHLWKYPENREIFIKELIKNGFCEDKEEVFNNKYGNQLIGLISAKTFELNGVTHIFSRVHDITSRKEGEKALLKSEARFRSYFELPHIGITIISPEKGWIEANEGITSMLGYSMEELSRRTWADMTHPDDLAADEEQFNKVIADQQDTYFIEKRFICKNGEIIWTSFSASCVRNNDRSVDYIIAILQDITQRKLAEDELRISEERYRLLAENSRDVIWTMKLDGTITYISPAVEQLRGFTVEEAMNQPIDKILTPDSQLIVIDYIHRINHAFNSGLQLESFKGENEYYCKDGSTLWTEVMVYPIQSIDKQSVTLLGVSRGISERKLAEEALKKSEEKFRSLYANMIDGSALHSLVFDEKGNPVDYVIRDINPAFETQLGISRESVINKTSKEAYDVSEPPYFDIYSRVALTENPEVFETYFAPLDKYFSISVYCPFKGSFATIFENITDRKKAEQELHIILTKYKVLFDIFPIGITISDVNENIIESNKHAESILGISKEEQEKRKISGKEWRIIRPDGTNMPPSEFASVRALHENCSIHNIEMGIVKENDQITWLNVSATPIPIEGYGVAIVYTDITSRKKIELDSIHTRRLLEDSQRIGKIGGWEMDLDTREFIWTNEMYHIHEVDFSFKPTADKRSNFYTPESLSLINEAINQIIHEGGTYEIDNEIITKNGNHKFVRSIGQADLENNRVFGLLQDVTDQKKAELALIASEEKYRNLFHKSKIGMFQTNLNFTKVLEVNEKLVQIIGYSLADLTENPKAIHFVNKNQLNELLLLLGQDKFLDDFEIEITSKDGSNKILLVSLTVYSENEMIVGSFVDITDRKRAEAELKIKNQQLNELNATKDKFFSIIAHDLKSPFNGILGLSSMLLNEARNLDIDSILKFTEIIHSSAKQTFSLLENLLDWAKTQQGGLHFEPSRIYIKHLISAEIKGINFFADQKNIHLIDHSTAEIAVFADEKMLSTVVRNLINNAIKFTPKDGSVTIKTSTENDTVLVSITDTGVGMDKETIDKLFKIESSFSTRGTENEKGTGLGLLLCIEFIEKHNGKIWAESEIGKGSKFTFSLPLTNL